MLRFIVVLIGLLALPAARGATHSIACSGNISSALKKAVSGASAGDTILIGEGTCIVKNVTVNKGLKILGADRKGTSLSGEGSTLFRFTGSGSGEWDFGVLTITGNNVQDIAIEGGFGSFRIHEIDIRSTSTLFAEIGSNTLADQLYHGGPAYRHKILFDNILLESSAPVQFVKIWGNNHVAWAEPDGFGTDNFIFIEDSEFRYIGTARHVTDTEGGGRFVFRHNKVINGMVAMHCTGSTQGMRGNRAVEIYSNEFTCTNSTAAGECSRMYAFEATRGGTGIFYDNRISGDYFTSVWPMHGRIAWSPGTGFPDYRFKTKCGTAGTRKICLDAQVHCTDGRRGPTARPHNYGGSASWGDQICGSRGEGQAGPDWSCDSDSDCNDINGRPGKCVQLDGLGRTGSEVAGYPCRDQFGRGRDNLQTGEQEAAPIYWWNNFWQGSPQKEIPGNQYSDFFMQNRDWCAHDPSTPCGQKAAWSYTPYPYPHPLRKGLSARKDEHTSEVRQGS